MMKRWLIKIMAAVAVASLIGAPSVVAATTDAQDFMRVKRIDRSDYPWITLHLSLTTTGKGVVFRVRENGRRITRLSIRSQANKQPVAVTLVMDVSGSMKDKPLEDAKAAARLFVDKARPADRVAIVAFSTTVTRLVDFTNDKDQLYRAIDSLQASGETAAYDALFESLIAGEKLETAHKSIILLSDGADTASQAAAATVTELAEKAKTPISAIALP